MSSKERQHTSISLREFWEQKTNYEFVFDKDVFVRSVEWGATGKLRYSDAVHLDIPSSGRRTAVHPIFRTITGDP